MGLGENGTLDQTQLTTTWKKVFEPNRMCICKGFSVVPPFLAPFPSYVATRH